MTESDSTIFRVKGKKHLLYFLHEIDNGYHYLLFMRN
ncbi:hypothetical protein SAMN05421784_11750 [Xenorhabdus koppenhoeferi]|uniref:Uncharacterized protein n=1 Tax=Xenorhabdus koppenhoeferi TaxID=351659 RepID=A0A1I7I0Y2_9GAMM|nr:hypothetical protein SAMN05421784_11750 [Xenorhabdus koppenhoeferi]